jgi:alanyl aminopeptidase
MTRALAAVAALAASLGASAISVGTSHAAETGASVAGDSPPSLRLPAGARPTRYELALTVVPGEATAHGEIAIDVELDRPHPILWLNADELTVSGASTDASATSAKIVAGNDQFVGVAFEPALAAGRHRVTLDFEAKQARDATQGIFALQYAGAWYAMTQFEALSARRAFPCFDEPDYKVPWRLTLRVPRDLVALSNTPVESETDLGSGMKAVRFAETRPLPSYLVAFAVGPWEIVDVGRVGMNPTPMRIVVPKGRTAEAAFVARAYPRIFEKLEGWFGVAHPYPKLDQVAIPLTVGFAMENAGLITYGAQAILAKPDAASPAFRHVAAAVGAHEMAHQWFGNLVTMAWWDDVWLNEAFATWLADKMVDAWDPGYEHGAGRARERAEAIHEDLLGSARRIREPIASRGDIFNAFDSITYQKGATVIGMFERWMGKAPFRRGVKRYLEAHRDANATAGDFLDALGAAADRPIGAAFSTFLDQNGVPRVGVRLQCSARGAKLELEQRRLTPLGETDSRTQLWKIPVCARYRSGAATREACTLLSDRAASLELGACPDFVVANAGGRGYYVADYRDGLLPRLAAHRGALTPAEYASVLYDLRELVRAGAASGAEALEWVRAAASSPDRHVVEAAVTLASFVRDTLIDEKDRRQFAAFVREAFGSRARTLGFAPKRRESDDEGLLRRSLIRLVAPEDGRLAAEARRLAAAWLGDRKAIDPGMVDVVLVAAAQTGDEALLDRFLGEAKRTSDSLDRRNLTLALLSFRDPALAEKGLRVLLDPEFDIRESMTALYLSERFAPPRRETHAFIAANFDALAKRVSRDAPGYWPRYAAPLCSQADGAAVAAFWRDRIGRYAGGARNLAETLEQIRLCTALKSAQGPAVAAFLAKP